MIKLFCKHDWKSHTKKEYEWKEKEVIESTRLWLNPQFQVNQYSSTVEILICKKCGKIHSLTY